MATLYDALQAARAELRAADAAAHDAHRALWSAIDDGSDADVAAARVELAACADVRTQTRARMVAAESAHLREICARGFLRVLADAIELVLQETP